MMREHGQALIMTLALSAALAAALLLVFNVGQLANAKHRLLASADAAAYSAAVWQARSLNYQAYLNRAVVANEAAIAQSVSLRSWSGYMNVTLDNINTVGQFIPYVGQVTRTLSRIWERLDAVLQPVLVAAEHGISELDRVYAMAAEGMHAAALAGTVPVVREVLARNAADNQLTRGGAVLLATNLRAYRSLTRTYDGVQRTRQADLALRSRDGFTRSRSWEPAIENASIPLALRKRGGTDLLGLDEWRAMDTLALHRRRGGLIGSWREASSIGWGGAQNGSRTWRRGDHGGSWRVNPRTSRRAQNATANRSGYRGIPALRDVVVGPRSSTAELRIAVEVARDRRSLRLADTVLRNTTVAVPTADRRLTFAGSMPRDQLRAIAEARVFFERPEPRVDGRRELASLYNPYWRARLAPVRSASRAAAAAANGIVDPFVDAR
ncbi:MAG: pilus assembly protein TadG-related protein [Steroidobacteraceae bacterium]